MLDRSEAALIAELKRTVEAWPLVRLLNDAPERTQADRNRVESAPLPENYQGIRNHTGGKKYEHGDPTADEALNPSPSKIWLERFEKMRAELAWLASNARDLVGDPIPTCPICEKPVTPEDLSRKSGGRTWHNRCYLRWRREA